MDGSSVLWMYHSPTDEVADMLELLPSSMKALDLVPDDAGTWLYHCHVNDHIKAGMLALFTVR